jgi:polyhydroxyalkanoate synthesis regulator phasin
MDIIKRTMLLGFGLASLTKEKAEGVVDDLVRRGEAARQDRFKAVDSLLKEAEKQEEEFTRKTTGMVRKVMTDLGLPTKKDLDAVSKTLTSIEQKLSSPDEKKIG